MSLCARTVLALALLQAGSWALADIKPLPPDQWPHTLKAAVPAIVSSMLPVQRSIIGGSSKDNLPLFAGEWGEEIQVLLGLGKGNTDLLQDVCGPANCTPDQAALRLMEATWDALQAAQ